MIFDPDDLVSRPIEEATTIPSRWYTDPAMHAIDCERIIGRSWQPVGRLDELPEVGCRIVGEVAGSPVLVLRGEAGELRAYFNVCRHRGGPIATEKGCSRMLQCRYHGWTYRLDGSLRGTPRFDRTILRDEGEYALVPLRVAAWEGTIFVTLEAGTPPLETIMAGISERIVPMRLGDLRFHHRDEYEVACNWKVYVDNYLEGYHVPLVHPGLYAMLEFADYRTEVHDHYSLQHSPLKEGGEAFYYLVFPNYMLNILPGRLQTNHVVPIAPDRCRVVFDYFYDDPDRRGAEEDRRSADETQWEDIAICEHVQKGLASRGYDKGRFSLELEGGVYHFHELLRRAYGEVRATSPAANSVAGR